MIEFKPKVTGTTRHITINDAAFYERVAVAAKRHGTSMTEIIRVTVNAWLDEDEKQAVKGPPSPGHDRG